VRREKNALSIALKAIYLVELARQVLEWRITAPNNKIKCVPENRLLLSCESLLSRFIGDNPLDQDKNEQYSFIYPKIRMTWTGTKVDLVELIYAWETAGCFNHGNASIKEIIAYIEAVFNIDLNGYYRMFIDMRRRADRTSFLDKLIKFLNDRMNEADRKK
jgi:hypothetical protein